MKKIWMITIAFLFLFLLSACDADKALDPTETPSPAFNPTAPGTCTGPYTGITVSMPNNGWKCIVDTNNESSETFYITSSVFDITITTQAHDPYCKPTPGVDTCAQKAFYENKSITLSAYSSNDELREIYGVRRLVLNSQGVPVSFSIKYKDMEHTILDPVAKQELIDFIDSISYGK